MKGYFKAYLSMWAKYFQFKGKTTRKDYWQFTIVNAGFMWTFLDVDIIAFLIFAAIAFIPGLTAAVRRIRDTGHNVWWVLFPPVAFIFLFQARKETVEISVKIHTNNFPEVPWKKKAKASKVVKFLLSDCGCAFDEETGKAIPGDRKIWYLGLAEKFGQLRYKDKIWGWGFGETSFTQVLEFVKVMFDDGFLNKKQMTQLVTAISEAESIEDMYKIGPHLQIKTYGSLFEQKNMAPQKIAEM